MTTPESKPEEEAEVIEDGNNLEDDSVEIVATTEAPDNETSSTLATIPFKGDF